MAPPKQVTRKEERAIQTVKDAVGQVERSFKQLDLKIKKIRKAMANLSTYSHGPGTPTWSFGPGRPSKKRRRR